MLVNILFMCEHMHMYMHTCMSVVCAAVSVYV